MAMLYRKITSYIEDYLKSDNDKILALCDGMKHVKQDRVTSFKK